MSPEQARGKTVDKRADIFAFGVVLYELLTGRALFHGETITDVLAAVLREDPDLTAVPARVRPLIRKCLEKDPKKRLRDIADYSLLIAADVEPMVAQSVPTPGRRPSWIAWCAAAAALAAAGGVSFVHFGNVS
jgi:serine/threonine-protein kinase